MNVETLISVVNGNAEEIIKKTNNKTNAIIINQCDNNSITTIKKGNIIIKYCELAERGVGLSRNNALIRATGDILLFVDEDEKLNENYEKIIINNFKKYKNADAILFNVRSLNKERPTATISKNQRAHKHNSLKYGAVNIAIKKSFVQKKRISFSLLFGGGAKYQSGEDSLLISDIFKNKGIVYKSKDEIGTVSQNTSTWFAGYNRKYLNNKGALFYSIYNKWWILVAILFLLKHPKIAKDNNGIINSLNQIKCGAKDYKYEK